MSADLTPLTPALAAKRTRTAALRARSGEQMVRVRAADLFAMSGAAETLGWKDAEIERLTRYLDANIATVERQKQENAAVHKRLDAFRLRAEKVEADAVLLDWYEAHPDAIVRTRGRLGAADGWALGHKLRAAVYAAGGETVDFASLRETLREAIAATQPTETPDAR